MTTYKKISIKQLDTLFENLKPLDLERRLTFLRYSNYLLNKDLISEENEDKYSTIDYIKDFEIFEKKYNKDKQRKELNKLREKLKKLRKELKKEREELQLEKEELQLEKEELEKEKEKFDNTYNKETIE